MAKLDFENYEKNIKSNSYDKHKSKVGYFSLKNDGDSAIVRFAYHSPKEFDIETVHTIEIDGKYRDVSCLIGNGLSSVDDCPLCKTGDKMKSKFYIKLLNYLEDSNGGITPTAQIWGRTLSFKNDWAKTLKGYFAEYGDLTGVVFKIIRRGSGISTTYECMPVRESMYPENIYKKDFSAFDDFVLCPHSYLERSKEDLQEYIDTGTMPAFKKTEQAENVDKKPTTTQPEHTESSISNTENQGFGSAKRIRY